MQSAYNRPRVDRDNEGMGRRLRCQEGGAVLSTQESINRSKKPLAAPLTMVSTEVLLLAATEGTTARATAQATRQT